MSRMTSASYRVVVALVCLLLSGCAIVGPQYHPFGTKTHRYESPKLDKTAKKDCYSASSRYPVLLTESDLIASWGPPDSRKKSGDVERLTYEGDRFWSGVALWVVVAPIPFELPINKSSCVVEIENGLIKAAEKHVQADDEFYGCGAYYDYSLSGDWEYGCGSSLRL